MRFLRLNEGTRALRGTACPFTVGWCEEGTRALRGTACPFTVGWCEEGTRALRGTSSSSSDEEGCLRFTVGWCAAAAFPFTVGWCEASAAAFPFTVGWCEASAAAFPLPRLASSASAVLPARMLDGTGAWSPVPGP